MDFNLRWEQQDAMVSRLVDKFKPLFPNPAKPNISFPCGWELLVTETLEKLAGNRNADKDLQILQIKDKFGGLRIYTNFSTERIQDILTDAEHRADSICMECGLESLEVTNQPSFQILCVKCTANYKKNNPEAYEEADSL